MMETFYKIYEKYLKTIGRLRFDPILLFAAAMLANSLKELVILYLILITVIHLPLIFYKN